MTPHDEIAQLTESLRLTQAELAKARFQLEELMEGTAATEEAAARTRELAEATSLGLAAISTGGAGAKGWVKRRLIRSLANDQESADIALLSATPLFDPVWYLTTYPATAATGLAPALHYLRLGAGAGLDPSASFSTKAYRKEHPDLGAENPLLHLLRTRAEVR